MSIRTHKIHTLFGKLWLHISPLVRSLNSEAAFPFPVYWQYVRGISMSSGQLSYASLPSEAKWIEEDARHVKLAATIGEGGGGFMMRHRK
ncbi:hypothetical protein L249_7733, partial [Ophiocordyceps polyrhachis-furcata BCC 54312]